MSTHPVPSLFYILALLSVLYLLFNLHRLTAVRIGKREDRPINFSAQLLNGIVFGFAQGKTLSKRFGYASVMHFLLGWGFIELTFATTVDFFTARGWFIDYLPSFDTPWFAALNDLGGLMVIAGTCMALARRYIRKPESLPHNDFRGRGNFLGDSGILLFILLLAIGGFLVEAARLAIEQPVTAPYSWVGFPLSKLATIGTWQLLKPWLWWSHALLALLFISILPHTKMFHILAVIMNVTLTNRQERGHLKPMYVLKLMEDPDLDVEEVRLGASEVQDFTWKQLLDTISCTECARCTTVCPAYATDKPLSPMKIITDIRQSLYKRRFGNRDSKPLIAGLVSETEIWSCTTCGACTEVCPVLIDHVPTFIDMRRYLVLSDGKPPIQANESLENSMQNGNPWGFSANDRLNWAIKMSLDVPVLSEQKSTDVLFWVGCAGSYDPRNQRISEAMVKIFRSAGVDFAVLGNEESCTGESARRIGEEYLFETLAQKNIETLNQYQFNKIVTTCPHCFHTLANEYPDFGTDYEVIHHSLYIKNLIASGNLNPDKHLDKNVTYHDACYLGRYNKIYDAPRDVIKSVLKDGNLVEMERNRNHSFCCGAGGGNMWYDIEEGKRMNLERFEEAIHTGVDMVVTACFFCGTMMEDAMKVKGKDDTFQILDIAEIISDGLNYPNVTHHP